MTAVKASGSTGVKFGLRTALTAASGRRAKQRVNRDDGDGPGDLCAADGRSGVESTSGSSSGCDGGPTGPTLSKKRLLDLPSQQPNGLDRGRHAAASGHDGEGDVAVDGGECTADLDDDNDNDVACTRQNKRQRESHHDTLPDCGHSQQ